MNIQQQIYYHLQQHGTIYIFMIGLFLMGIIFGSVIVNSMNFIQKEDLYFYLSQFFEQIVDESAPSFGAIFKNSYFFHLKYLLLIYVLGLSIIGLPLVWILVFLKGLFIGFTVGFIVNQLGVQGLILAAISIAPQNLIIIPMYVIAGSFAMIFSLLLMRKLIQSNISFSILRPFQIYSVIFVVLLITSLVSSVLETYVSHSAMYSYLKTLYN